MPRPPVCRRRFRFPDEQYEKPQCSEQLLERCQKFRGLARQGGFKRVLANVPGTEKPERGYKKTERRYQKPEIMSVHSPNLPFTEPPFCFLSTTDWNPHDRVSCAPAFSERFHKNWGGPCAPEFRVRKISPKFSCIKFFQIRDVPTQISGYPGYSLSKQQKKVTCIKFLSGISRRLGSGCPRNIPPKNFMF